MHIGILARRTSAALALAALAAILGYYVDRLFLPQPIYAGDVGAYLITALFSPEAAARNPLHAEVGDSLFLMGIRAAHALSVHYQAWVRVGSLAGYLGGLVAVHRVSTAGLPGRDRWEFLLLALAFPYYRFVVTALPEGAYVAVLALIAVATARLYATRPWLHAVAAGGLAAALALIKPHGVAVAVALAGLAVLEAVVTGRFGRGAMRIGVLAAAFVAGGAAIQFAAGEPFHGPLTFFIGDYYGNALAVRPPHGSVWLGLLGFFAMTSALALLAGPACAVALGEIAGRWRLEGRNLMLQGQDAAILLLILAALATLTMVGVFTVKVSGEPAETLRLWGRYFEFFAPLIWLAASPYLVRWAREPKRPTRWTCAGLMLAGLAGLLIAFRLGIVLFPWDATALTAFFHPDPVRAPLGVRMPYRALAVAISLAAAAAIAWRAKPWRAAAGLFLALGLLSTWLDHVWVGPIVQKRAEFDADIRVAARMTPDEPDRNAVLAADNNDGNLGYLGLDGFAHVLPATADAPPPPQALAFENLVVVRPARPPAGWACPYRGKQLDVCVRPPVAD